MQQPEDYVWLLFPVFLKKIVFEFGDNIFFGHIISSHVTCYQNILFLYNFNKLHNNKILSQLIGYLIDGK